MKNLFLISTFLLVFFTITFSKSDVSIDLVEANFSYENACLYQLVSFTDLSVGNVTSWSWDFANGAGTSDEQDPEFTFSGAGTFTVQLIVFSGADSDTISKQIVIQNEIPTFRDTIVCNNEPVIFNGKTYQEQVASPTVFNYIDTLLSTGGCDSISVFRVTVNPCGCELFFPNAFTPDGDGVNDFFSAYVVCDQEIANFEMIIYDRWGETVFETYEYQEQWDGTINGYPMPTDVFVYWVQYEIVDGNNRQQFKEVKDVTLIR